MNGSGRCNVLVNDGLSLRVADDVAVAGVVVGGLEVLLELVLGALDTEGGTETAVVGLGLLGQGGGVAVDGLEVLLNLSGIARKDRGGGREGEEEKLADGDHFGGFGLSVEIEDGLLGWWMEFLLLLRMRSRNDGKDVVFYVRSGIKVFSSLSLLPRSVFFSFVKRLVVETSLLAAFAMLFSSR